MTMTIDFWGIVAAAFSIGTLVISSLVGFVAKGAVSALRDLRDDHSNMRGDIASIRETIAGNYISRRESQEARQRLHDQLQEQMDRLSERVHEIEITRAVRRVTDND